MLDTLQLTLKLAITLVLIFIIIVDGFAHVATIILFFTFIFVIISF